MEMERQFPSPGVWVRSYFGSPVKREHGRAAPERSVRNFK